MATSVLCIGSDSGASRVSLTLFRAELSIYELADPVSHLTATLGDFETLLPQGLYMKIDQTSRDPKSESRVAIRRSWLRRVLGADHLYHLAPHRNLFNLLLHRADWRLVGWLYGGKYYPGTAAFLAAFNSPSFETYTRNEGVDGSWAMTDKKGADLPLDSRAPPMQILPEGKRWKIDAGAKFVVYQDFSFFIGFTRDTGVRLFDIKYKGERIIYELGLQEALAHCECSPIHTSSSKKNVDWAAAA